MSFPCSYLIVLSYNLRILAFTKPSLDLKFHIYTDTKKNLTCGKPFFLLRCMKMAVQINIVAGWPTAHFSHLPEKKWTTLGPINLTGMNS